MTSALKIGLDPVFTYHRYGKTYQIVRTADIHWMRHCGFKPKQPYVILANGSVFNGVTEADLAWYRAHDDPTEAPDADQTREALARRDAQRQDEAEYGPIDDETGQRMM